MMNGQTFAEDPRCSLVLDFVKALRAGNFTASLPAPEKDDELDELMTNLEALRDELRTRYIADEEASEQIGSALNVLGQFGRQNYRAEMPVEGKRKHFDAMARGINRLGWQLRKTTRELEQTSKKLEFFLQHANDVILISNRHTGQIEFANRRAEQVLGYTAEELQGRLNETLLHTDSYCLLKAAEPELQATGSATFELRLVTKNGNALWMQNSTCLLDFADEAMQMCCLRDITQQHEQERKLVEQSQFLQKVVDTSQGGFMILDIDSKIREVNQAYCDLMGYKREELLNLSILEVDVYATEEAWNTHFTELQAAGHMEFETNHRKKNGEIALIHVSVSFLMQDNKPAIAAFVRDITQERQIFEELQRSEANMRSMLRVLPDIICRISGEGEFLECHAPPEKEHLINADIICPKETEPGKVRRMVPKNDECYSLISAALQTGEVQQFVMERELAGKRNFYEGRLVRSADNEVLKIVRDVTVEKRNDLVKQVIYNIAKKSSEANLSEAAFCAYIHQQLAQLMDVSEFYISRLAGKEHISFIYMADSVHEQQAPFDRQLGNGLTEYIIRTGKPLLLTGKSTKAFQKKMGLHIYGKEAACWLGAPLLVDGRAIGVIACQSYTNDQLYNETDLEILHTVGRQIGLWLERKRGRENQEAVLRVIDTSVNEIYVVDVETGKFKYANQIAQQNLGYTAEEISKLTPMKVAREISPEKFKALVAELRSGKASKLRFESTHTRKNGTHYPVEVHVQIGQFLGTNALIANIIDITERKEQEREIESYVRHFAMSTDLHCIADVSGHFKAINHMFPTLLGYSREKLLSTPFVEFVHPEDRENTIQVMSALLEGETVVDFRNRYQCANGDVIWLSWSCTPDTETGLLYAVARDITALCQAESALLESEKRFKSIFELAEFGIALIDSKNRYVQVNSRYAQILGLAPNDMLGHTFQEYTHKEDRKAENKRSRNLQSAEANATLHYEKRYVHHNGHTVYARLGLSKIQLGDQQFIISVMSDISEQKCAQAALIRSEALLRQAQQLAGLGSWEWDLSTQEIQFSGELCSIYGLGDQPAVLSRDEFLSCVHSDFRDELVHTISNSIKNRQSWVFTHPIAPQLNGAQFIEARGDLKFDRKGKPVKMYGSAMDVSEREKAQRLSRKFTRELEAQVQERTLALEISQNELRQRVATMDRVAMVFVADTQGRIMYVNDAFCKASGYKASELLGQSHGIMSVKDDPNATSEHMWQEIQSGHTWEGEIQNRGKDGKLFWVSSTVVPFLDVDGQIEKYISVSFDIDTSKQLQTQLQKALEKEKELGELKSRFVATASHQFRTPMAIIQSNSELLEMVAENSDAAVKHRLSRFTGRINQEVKRMTTMLDEVLLLGKATAGGLTLSPSTINLQTLCTALCDQFNSIQPDGRTVQLQCEGERFELETDAKLVGDALGNLISNAFKYSGSCSPTLLVRAHKNHFVVAVKDCGIGIPEKDLDNLFRPFYRAQNVGEIAGTGLGLSIAKEYLELCQGSIEVKSKQERGTTFTVRLPRKLKLKPTKGPQIRNRNSKLKPRKNGTYVNT